MGTSNDNNNNNYNNHNNNDDDDDNNNNDNNNDDDDNNNININLIYIAQFDINGILTALCIVIKYIQTQYTHIMWIYMKQSCSYMCTCLHIYTFTDTPTNMHLDILLEGRESKRGLPQEVYSLPAWPGRLLLVSCLLA